MCKMHFCVLADLSIMKKMREALSTMYIMDQITEAFRKGFLRDPIHLFLT